MEIQVEVTRQVVSQEPRFVVRGIPAQLVERFWPFAEPYIKRALDHTCGEFSAANFKDFCKDRTVQLWLIFDGERVVGAVTTELVNYPQKRHCKVITLAGSNAQEWAEHLDIMLRSWAKQNGCEAIEAYVRKGFVPKLMEHGYKHKYSVVVKEI